MLALLESMCDSVTTLTIHGGHTGKWAHRKVVTHVGGHTNL